MQLLATRITVARVTSGRGTRKMLKWPRKPTMATCKKSEKKKEEVRRSPAGERRFDLWPAT